MNSHICHIITTLSTGGAEQYVVQISNYLHSNGHRVSIVAGKPHSLRDRLESGVHIENVEFLCEDSRSIFRYMSKFLRTCIGLVKYFSNEKVTTVHTHLAASALPAWIAAKWLGIPVIHSRMYAGNIGSRLEHVLFATRLPLLLVDRFLVFTHYSEKEVKQQWHVPAEKIVVSSIGVDTSRFINDETLASVSRRELDLSSKDRVLLVVARLHPEKDVELAIRAARMLDDANTTLIIVGDGEERKRLESLASELHGQTRIRFLGLLKDPRPAFAAADLLLQTSRSPNLGTVVLEAMASSLPVLIAFRDENEYLMAVDTFENEDVGVIEKAQPIALADSIATLVGDQVRLQDMRKRARDFIEIRHSKKSVYSALADVYAELERC